MDQVQNYVQQAFMKSRRWNMLVLEQNGQLSLIQYGDQDLRYPLIIDGQLD